MAAPPQRYCLTPGCRAKVRRGHCPVHARALAQTTRGLRKRALGNPRRYREKVRLPFLALHPLCLACKAEGITRLASEIDHIEPHRDNPEKFWNWSNLQALCKSHHFAKTRQENRTRACLEI
jgi:5-methylcytosine-specific restriction protein A